MIKTKKKTWICKCAGVIELIVANLLYLTGKYFIELSQKSTKTPELFIHHCLRQAVFYSGISFMSHTAGKFFSSCFSLKQIIGHYT